MRIVVWLWALCAVSGIAYAEDPDAYHKGRLTEIAKTNWPRVIENLDRAEAFVKAGKIEDARSRYRGVKQGAEVVQATFDEILTAAPHLRDFSVPISADGKYTSAAAKVLKAATDAIKIATEKEAALAQRVAAESGAAKDAAIKSLAGDRKKVFEQRGRSLPRAWDGSTSTSPKTYFGTLKTSAYWLYEWTNGCAMTYRFKGNKLIKTETKPAGCTP